MSSVTEASNADVEPQIAHVQAQFSRIYLGGIPSLLNDDGAFLSFVCALTAIEALAGFLDPESGNGERFRRFVREYFSDPYPSQADDLWRLRNASVHGFSPGPYALTHHNGHAHLTRTRENRLVLNAEDFYAALVIAARKYFDGLARDSAMQTRFLQRLKDPRTGVTVVGSVELAPRMD